MSSCCGAHSRSRGSVGSHRGAGPPSRTNRDRRPRKRRGPNSTLGTTPPWKRRNPNPTRSSADPDGEPPPPRTGPAEQPSDSARAKRAPTDAGGQPVVHILEGPGWPVPGWWPCWGRYGAVECGACMGGAVYGSQRCGGVGGGVFFPRGRCSLPQRRRLKCFSSLAMVRRLG